MKNRWGILMVVIVVGAIIIKSLNTAGTAAMADAANSAEAASSRTQLSQLLAASEGLIQGSRQATVKWQGEWHTMLSLEAAGERLADRLGLADRYTEKVHGNQVFYAEGSSGEAEDVIHGKLALTLQEEGSYYVILRLENGTDESLQRLPEAGESWGELLLREGVRAKWNAALQGEAAVVSAPDWPDFWQNDSAGAGEANPMPALAAFAKLESRIKEQLKLRAVESFADERTVSKSYSTEDLPIKARSAGQEISLQIGLHWNTESERYDVSIGSPLLTVEY
ncbi:YwmB family TATA-box binding protein [Paenibacillus sp. FSL W8-0186]|uniref:YwmB family TATA-box binding protein n=1 Tax=Paenibacillus sp. FSL W8-0186 TaxID=2921709 RepID=UPI0030CD0440